MKKILKFLKNNLLGLVLGLIIGGCTIVVADNLISSRLISFDKDKLKINKGIDTDAETVEEALNELYEKASHVGKCPEGFICLSSSIQDLQVGDLIKMVPTETSVKLDGTKSGYTTYDTTATYLNPSELQYWRVIRKNDNGTVDVVSEYVSSVNVVFSGVNGYKNYIAYLNELASHYENSNYTTGSRHMGYDSTKATETLISTSAFDGSSTNYPWSSSTSSSTTKAEETLGAGDMGYETDYNLVINAYKNTTLGGASGTAKAFSVGTTNEIRYLLASRKFSYSNTAVFSFSGRYVDTSGNLETSSIRTHARDWSNYGVDGAIRPILTLKSTITISSVESITGAYILG